MTTLTHPEKDTPAHMLRADWEVYRNGAWHKVVRVQPHTDNQRVYVVCEDATYLIPGGDLVPAEMP